jgi:hypothetical protein
VSGPTAEAVARYAAFWSGLAPGTTSGLAALADPAMVFRDPLQEIVGVERVVGMLDRMFVALGDPRFVVRRTALGAGCAFYAWTFTAIARRRSFTIEGVSEVEFDSADRVTRHVDHFDAGMQVYARIPLLGGVLQVIRRRIALHG